MKKTKLPVGFCLHVFKDVFKERTQDDTTSGRTLLENVLALLQKKSNVLFFVVAACCSVLVIRWTQDALPAENSNL